MKSPAHNLYRYLNENIREFAALDGRWYPWFSSVQEHVDHGVDGANYNAAICQNTPSFRNYPIQDGFCTRRVHIHCRASVPEICAGMTMAVFQFLAEQGSMIPTEPPLVDGRPGELAGRALEPITFLKFDGLRIPSVPGDFADGYHHGFVVFEGQYEDRLV